MKDIQFKDNVFIIDGQFYGITGVEWLFVVNTINRFGIDYLIDYYKTVYDMMMAGF